MKKIFVIFFLNITFLFADSVTLYNDSIFELTAIVRGANGKVLAQQTLAPGEQSGWNTDQKNTELEAQYSTTSSYTPFTIVWQCSYEGIFSVGYNVASGATVVATECSGPHYCKPKPKESEKNQTSCNSCKKLK
jgi:hypothetical protein